MKGYADNLFAIVIIIFDNELLLHILDGLGLDSNAIVVNLISRVDNVTLEEAQFQLQSYELILAQFNTSQMIDLSNSEVNMARRNNSMNNWSF